MKKLTLKDIAFIFILGCQGSIMIPFALMTPMLIGAVGVAMDVSQAYLVRQRLHGSIDAAALAAAATTQDDGEIETRVNEFLRANYPEEKIGTLNIADIEVDVTQSEVTVVATATFSTTFMRILGFTTIDVSARTIVAREIKGLEAVLVLDNTGSLGASNMASLKTAAINFVTILFDRVAEPDDIKIGLVPYASAVRVGNYGLGRFPDGTAGYGTPFVTLPGGMSLTNDKASGWFGCVREHFDDGYNDAALHVVHTSSLISTTSRGQLWSTGIDPNDDRCATAATCRGHGWDPARTDNDPYPDDTEDTHEGPWDIYQYGKIISRNGRCTDNPGTGYTNAQCSSCNPNSDPNSTTRNRCNQEYCFCWHNTPNIYCPAATVVPLTSEEDDLIAGINSMTHEGATVSNVGMAWGMRLLSRDEPFIEGSEWGDEEWNKAIILMTDGQVSIDNAHSTAYGPATKYTGSITNAVLEDRLLEVCTWLKAEPRNVIIYAVTFDHATANITDDTKDIYRQCATDADHYFDAPTQARLVTVFEQISGALANLHLKR